MPIDIPRHLWNDCPMSSFICLMDDGFYYLQSFGTRLSYLVLFLSQFWACAHQIKITCFDARWLFSLKRLDPIPICLRFIICDSLKEDFLIKQKNVMVIKLKWNVQTFDNARQCLIIIFLDVPIYSMYFNVLKSPMILHLFHCITWQSKSEQLRWACLS